LVDEQSSITADLNRRLFFKSSHNEMKFGYAVQSCFVKLGGNFLVDGYNSFCGEYKQNQNISGGSVAYVNDVKINGRNVNITGQVVQVQTCEVDVSQIIDKARQSNNNSVIPPQFIRDGKLKLENNDKLTLPSGVYYFREMKVSGRAVLGFLGPATVVAEGDVSVEGQGQIKTNPVFLRIISTGRVKVEGQGAIYGGIVGNEVKVDGKGQIFGGVISTEFKGEGQGAVHFDKGLGLDRIEVFPSEVTIKVGETVRLTAVAKDVFGNEISCVGFEWSSSDPSVAVADQNGLVQGVGEGRAIISATAKKEGYNLAFKGEAIVNVIISQALCPFISSYSLWARVYGGPGDDLNFEFKRTSDGGYIIVGQTFSFGAGGGDLLVMKLDSQGNIQWQKTYGGPGHDWTYDVEETQNGGYIVGGGTGSFGAGGWDMWILKLDSHGNVQWQKTYGGWGVGIDGLNVEYVHDLAKTSDGGYIVVGGTTSYGAGDRDIWVLKLDSQENVQWQRTFGSSLFDWSYHVGQTSDGGYIISGATSFGLGFLGGGWGYDFWVLKIDSQGNIQWQKTYGGWSLEAPETIQQTSDGGYILVGGTQSFGFGPQDMLIIKLDSQGNIQWAKTYGGIGDEIGFYIRQTKDGGYIVSGSTSSFGTGGIDLLVLKLDTQGNVQWAKTYGGPGHEYPWGAVIDRAFDGGYTLLGSTSSFGAGGYDIWVLKLDSNGDIPGCGFIANANVGVIDISSLIYISVPNPVIGVPPFSGVGSNALIREINFACSLLLQCVYQ
jgi:uncharacterized protein YjdB/predicted secreted protein